MKYANEIKMHICSECGNVHRTNTQLVNTHDFSNPSYYGHENPDITQEMIQHFLDKGWMEIELFPEDKIRERYDRRAVIPPKTVT